VGSPRKFRGVDLIKSVARRLKEIGFRTETHREAEAVLAFKRMKDKFSVVFDRFGA
jgi:predicted methyltransferase